MCYDRIKQSVQQEELFRGLGSQRVTSHRPAESVVLLTGRRPAEIHERCCVARLSLKGPRGRVGGEAAIKGRSGLMWDDLCKQCCVRGEWSGNILCD